MAGVDYHRMAGRAARRWGLDPYIFRRQIRQESGYAQDVITGRRRSSAGALGIAQIMPGTARAWGVNPLNPRQALNAAAKHMAAYVRQYGNYNDALRAYNAGPGNVRASRGFKETNAYVKAILGPGSGTVRAGARNGPSGSLGVPGASMPLNLGGGVRGIPEGGADVLSLLRSMGEQAPAASGSLPQAPASVPQAALPAGYQLPPGGGGPAPKPDIGALLAAVQTPGGEVPLGTPGLQAGGMAPGTLGVNAAGRRGRVVLDPNADRPGVRTHQFVIAAAQRVSALSGHPVRISTGTRHSRMTVNGNVSDHWSGNAADIPATGRRLIELGQAALIDAGMAPRKARQQRGGLYNVHGAQVIFNTTDGGDHTTHLHYAPARGRRG